MMSFSDVGNTWGSRESKTTSETKRTCCCCGCCTQPVSVHLASRKGENSKLFTYFECDHDSKFTSDCHFHTGFGSIMGNERKSYHVSGLRRSLRRDTSTRRGWAIIHLALIFAVMFRTFRPTDPFHDGLDGPRRTARPVSVNRRNQLE